MAQLPRAGVHVCALRSLINLEMNLTWVCRYLWRKKTSKPMSMANFTRKKWSSLIWNGLSRWEFENKLLLFISTILKNFPWFIFLLRLYPFIAQCTGTFVPRRQSSVGYSIVHFHFFGDLIWILKLDPNDHCNMPILIFMQLRESSSNGSDF